MSWNNQVILIGSLGADPEVRHSQNGVMAMNFRIATTERWKDKATSAQKEETEWHSCVLFGKQAEDAAPHLAKGSYVRIEGKIKTESYEKDGQKRYTTKIHVSHVAPAAFPKSDRQAPPAGNQIPFGSPQQDAFAAAGIDPMDIY